MPLPGSSRVSGAVGYTDLRVGGEQALTPFGVGAARPSPVVPVPGWEAATVCRPLTPALTGSLFVSSSPSLVDAEVEARQEIHAHSMAWAPAFEPGPTSPSNPTPIFESPISSDFILEGAPVSQREGAGHPGVHGGFSSAALGIPTQPALPNPYPMRSGRSRSAMAIPVHERYAPEGNGERYKARETEHLSVPTGIEHQSLNETRKQGVGSGARILGFQTDSVTNTPGVPSPAAISLGHLGSNLAQASSSHLGTGGDNKRHLNAINATGVDNNDTKESALARFSLPGENSFELISGWPVPPGQADVKGLCSEIAIGESGTTFELHPINATGVDNNGSKESALAMFSQPTENSFELIS